MLADLLSLASLSLSFPLLSRSHFLSPLLSLSPPSLSLALSFFQISLALSLSLSLADQRGYENELGGADIGGGGEASAAEVGDFSLSFLSLSLSLFLSLFINHFFLHGAGGAGAGGRTTTAAGGGA